MVIKTPAPGDRIRLHRLATIHGSRVPWRCIETRGGGVDFNSLPVALRYDAVRGSGADMGIAYDKVTDLSLNKVTD